MLTSADSSHLRSVRDLTVSTLKEVLGGERNVAIVDAPNQRNVGDSLIWAGEMAYVEELGLRVRYVADLWTYDPAALRRAMPSGVILLHGGGNFGDLWPGHQILREMVVADLPDYRIIQLPQSIQFRDEERARVANTIIGAHPDFTALIRDHISLQRAAHHLPDVSVRFCPDMALGWDAPQVSVEKSVTNVLVIARADMEASSNLASVGDDWLTGAKSRVTDWWPRGKFVLPWRLARSMSLVYRFYVKVRKRWRWLPVGWPDKVGAFAIKEINRVNIAGAVDMYARARVIVVDRLHAHVLAVLLGIPHVVMDNNYRKISAIYEEYSGEFSTAHYATDLASARFEAERLLEV